MLIIIDIYVTKQLKLKYNNKQNQIIITNLYDNE